MPGTLWMIPTTLGGPSPRAVLPAGTIDRIHSIEFFLVENAKTARAFLKSVEHPVALPNLRIETLDNDTSRADLERMIQTIAQGMEAGVLSEAGCPALADPGSNLAKLAHDHGVRVAPLTGPSSVTLALIASGLETQRFAFLGYLPVKAHERDQAIRAMEERSGRNVETQIFIETPYRNAALFDALLKICHPDTWLCIACDLTMDDEFIATRSVREWRKTQPSLDKKPCVFLLLSQFKPDRKKHAR